MTKPRKKPRITITIDEEVLASVNEFAKKNGISRAGAVSVLVNQALNNAKALDGFSDLSHTLRELQHHINQGEK